MKTREPGISGKLKIKKIIYHDKTSYWGAYDVEEVELDEGSPKPIHNSYGGISLTGELAHPALGQIINCTTELVENAKYGKQYKILSVKMDLDLKDPESKREYLEATFTPMEVMRLYHQFPDPFQILMDRNAAELLKVKGFGRKTVGQKIEKFHENLDVALIITELKDFDITMKLAMKLLNVYHNAEICIKTIKDNPYRLIRDVDGIGFKKADALALKAGLGPHDIKRVEAFMYYYMDELGKNGDSWLTPEELMGGIQDNLGSDIPGTVITDAIHEMQEKNDIWCDNEHTKIGLYKYYRIENELAEHLIRLRDANNTFEYSNWEEAIKRQEEKQGWQFEEEQIEGIKACLENNVVYVTGGAGTGKSSTVGGMLAAFGGRYNYTQCALAGRAASRLSEITGSDGFTIHKLLGAQGDGTFTYNEEFPLDIDIVIVDEVSMISVDLMLKLVRAIPTGSKLIMLGDSNQLESIGAGNFAHDIMNSDEIKTIHLTKIHRQARKSGIVTSSLKVSEGTQLISKGFVGKETRGELEDFHIDSYEDKSHTLYAITQHVSTLLANGVGKNDIEVIVPMKERGDSSVYNLNLVLQNLINPKKNLDECLPSGQEVTSYIGKNMSYTFRVGDRVINRQNNYDTDPEIFNGNIGEIREIRGRSDEYPLLIYFYGIGEVLIPRSAVNNIHLAYAITCHSAQGSEFNNVIVGLDYNSYSLLTRQWVYTAITRAKKDCILCCENGALRYAISQNYVTEKHTHLGMCLYTLTHPIL